MSLNNFSSALLLRIERLSTLSKAETAAIQGMESTSRSYRKRETLLHRNGTDRGLAILRSGWATRRATGSDGRTAITHVFGAGDVIGLSDLGMSTTPHEVVMQTDGSASVIKGEQLGRFAQDHPRLLTILMAMSQVEDIVLRDRFFAATRLSAEDRLMHFLLAMQSKVPVQGESRSDKFPMHLNQREIGDALGLTDIYINRLLRSLVEKNAIAVNRPYVRILDPDTWSERVGFKDRYAETDLGFVGTE